MALDAGSLVSCPDSDYIQVKTIGDFHGPGVTETTRTFRGNAPPSRSWALRAYQPATASAPALRTFLTIADLWGLTEEERRLILGYPSRSTFHNWAKLAREHQDLTLGVDVLTRISAMLGIHQALGILYTTEPDGMAWLRGPHDGAVFGGKPPIGLVTSGSQDGLMTVRRFLDAARGGQYMEPNTADTGFLRYDEADVVLR